MYLKNSCVNNRRRFTMWIKYLSPCCTFIATSLEARVSLTRTTCYPNILILFSLLALPLDVLHIFSNSDKSVTLIPVSNRNFQAAGNRITKPDNPNIFDQSMLSHWLAIPSCFVPRPSPGYNYIAWLGFIIRSRGLKIFQAVLVPSLHYTFSTDILYWPCFLSCFSFKLSFRSFYII